MTFGLEQPILPFVRETPSVRRRKRAAVAAATARAEFRRAVADLAAHTSGTLEDKRRAIAGAIQARLIPQGRVPCLEAIRRLERKYRDGKVSAAEYRDDLTPRGPRAAPVPVALIDAVHELAIQHGTGDLRHLAHLASRAARALGEEPLSEWRLRRVLHAIGLHVIAAGRQGSRAAELDAVPRGTYPTRATHDLWLLDEGDSRYWARALCRVRSVWYSVRPWVILVRDHRSGAFVAGRVVDPSRRIDEETNRSAVTGFDANDVLATLLSAACPELASPGTLPLAGALPARLRWDNARAHRSLEQTVFAPGRIERVEGIVDPDADDSLETDAIITTERIPVRRPDRNGAIERMMSLVKRWMVGLSGHVDEVIPEDRLVAGEDLGRARAQAAVSTSARQPRLDPVPVMALPTIEELQAALDDVIRRYNEEHVLRRHGLTPIGAARKFMPRTHRRGADLVRTLDLAMYTVNQDGIVVQRNGHSVAFEAVHNGVLLQLGASVQVYVDPLLRGLWLEQGRYLVPCKPKWDHAAAQDPGDVARSASGPARAASDAAAATRAERLDRHHGAGTAAAGHAAYAAARAAAPSTSGESAPNAGPSGTSQNAPPTASSAPPAGATDFDPSTLLPPEPGDVTDV